MTNLFRRFAHSVAGVVGSPWAFCVSVMVVVVWAAAGPIFHYSDTWQLVINTGTTIVTFLIVFLIQNTQNRDSKAMHLKLDELIRSGHSARNALMALENFSDEELAQFEEEFKKLRERATRAKSPES
jgi:low affinity Fe/Cu permease